MSSNQPVRTDRRTAEGQGREKTSWQVTHVWDVHHQIKRRIFLGHKNTVIAQALNITKEQVSTVRNSAPIQEALTKLHQKADEEVINIKAEVGKLAPMAVKVMEEILEGPDVPANVRLAAARDTLDRSGNAAPQQVQHLHGHFTVDDLEQIKNRAQLIGQQNGPVVDHAQPEDVIELPIQ